jgi:hypothetical protein
MKLLQPGFYHHYKHDPSGGFANYTYEVLGLTRDTESDELSVLYRPLYKSTPLPPAEFYVRPLDMFVGEMRVGEKALPRFTKITDPSLIGQLEKVRNEMYLKK